MSNKRKKHYKRQFTQIHLHVGIYVAIAALVITAMKSSQGMIAAIYGYHGNDALSHTFLREAETHTGHAQLYYARLPRVSGA